MSYDTAHEAAFIDAFMLPKSAQRARCFLKHHRRRRDLLNKLFRGDFRPEKSVVVPRGQLGAVLRSVKPDVDQLDCYVIAQIGRFDQTTRKMKDCLDEDLDINHEMTGCFILSIEPGRLAVYWEDYNNTATICRA